MDCCAKHVASPVAVVVIAVVSLAFEDIGVGVCYLLSKALQIIRKEPEIN